MEDKMNNRELTKKYKELSYDADVLRRRAGTIEGCIGDRMVEMPGLIGAVSLKPSLTKEIDDLKKTISMLFDYLDVVIQKKERRIVKNKYKIKTK